MRESGEKGGGERKKGGRTEGEQKREVKEEGKGWEGKGGRKEKRKSGKASWKK